MSVSVTVKVTGLRTAADKKHVGPVNLLYIIMFEMRKIKQNFIIGPVKANMFLMWLSSEIKILSAHDVHSLQILQFLHKA